MAIKPEHLWNLDVTIARYLIPRLVEFKGMVSSYPEDLGSIDRWREVLDQIILSMKLTVRNNEQCDLNRDELKEMRDGHKLLGEYFADLWD